MNVSQSYIRSMVLVGFCELVRRHGGDPDAIMAECGIDPEASRHLDWLVPFAGTVRMVQMAAEHLDRPAFGIEWALSLRPHFANMGPIVLMSLFMRDARDWVETAINYWSHHCNGFTIEVIEGGDEVIGRYVGNGLVESSRQQIEHVFANILAAVRDMIHHDDATPTRLRFRHGPPKSQAAHAEAFGCPIDFNADRDEIVYSRSIMDRRTGGNLRMLKPLVDHFIRYRLRRLPTADQSMTTTVGLAIPGVLGAGRCNAEFVAGILGVTPKKLQRLLAAEATTFSAILDQTRHNIARQMLIESDAPVARIAGLLDYSATPPFTIAFRRWTGQSPLQFRRGERERLARSVRAKRERKG